VENKPVVLIQPILSWWAAQYPPHQRSNCVCCIGGVCGSVESLARKVGASHSTMYRRIRTGTLTIDEADRWAITCGVNPIVIWERWDRLRTCRGEECEQDA